MERSIYAVDIGSTRPQKRSGGKPSFAWARIAGMDVPPTCGSDIQQLVDWIASDLEAQKSVALGLEAPLSLPVPEEAARLCHGRNDEGRRSCLAPIGLAVAALAVHQSAWLLRALHKKCGNIATLTVNPADWRLATSPVLFIWEAFVSEGAHSSSHLRDAATAACFFKEQEANLEAAWKVHAQRPISLLGAAALWSGWWREVDILAQELLVLRPEQKYGGPLHHV